MIWRTGAATPIAPARPPENIAMPRNATLEIATVDVKIAVPSPMATAAANPAALMSSCQAITNRKIAPVQGRIAMLATSTAAWSCHGLVPVSFEQCLL